MIQREVHLYTPLSQKPGQAPMISTKKVTFVRQFNSTLIQFDAIKRLIETKLL